MRLILLLFLSVLMPTSALASVDFTGTYEGRCFDGSEFDESDSILRVDQFGKKGLRIYGHLFEIGRSKAIQRRQKNHEYVRVFHFSWNESSDKIRTEIRTFRWGLSHLQTTLDLEREEIYFDGDLLKISRSYKSQLHGEHSEMCTYSRVQP